MPAKIIKIGLLCLVLLIRMQKTALVSKKKTISKKRKSTYPNPAGSEETIRGKIQGKYGMVIEW